MKEFICITAKNHPSDVGKYTCNTATEAADKFREEYSLREHTYIEIIEPKEIWIFEK